MFYMHMVLWEENSMSFLPRGRPNGHARKKILITKGVLPG